MYQQVYYMTKYSGTYADALAAYGLATVIQEVLARTRGRQRDHGVRLLDAGPYYEVSFKGGPLTETEVGACDFFSLAYTVTGGRAKSRNVVADAPKRDVDEMWDQVKAFSARRSELWDEGIRGTDLENQLRDMEPPPDWTVVTWLGDGRMQAQGINNRLVKQWYQTREYFTINLKTIFRMCATPDMDLGEIADSWGQETGFTRKSERTTTSSQLFNPHQGKGLNRPKANALRMENIKVFWLLEYLKMCGLWSAAAPRQAPTRERKTYVLNPLRIGLRDHQEVFREFSRRLWNQRQRDNTSLKLDITSVLLYVQTLLEYSEAAQEKEDFGIQFDVDFGPEQVVNGMHVVQYKLLSPQSYTVTHMGFLGLPCWSEGAQNRKQIYDLKGVIDEHLLVVRGIDEGRSDGYDLLRRYRNFVTGDQWDAFFDFAVGYSSYLMREMNKAYRKGQSPRVWGFSEKQLEVLMGTANIDLLPILQNEGFRRIAKAIRQSTVQAQYFRYERNDRRYDVRYGLGQELARKAHDAAEFAAALGEFIRDYNAESAQVREGVAKRHDGNIPEEEERKLRGRISEDDLADLLSLIPEFGSEVVCHLLVAVGYSRGSRSSSNDEDQ